MGNINMSQHVSYMSHTMKVQQPSRRVRGSQSSKSSDFGISWHVTCDKICHEHQKNSKTQKSAKKLTKLRRNLRNEFSRKTLNLKNLKRKWVPEFAARCLGKGSDGLAAHPCLIHLQRVTLCPPLRSWEMTR